MEKINVSLVIISLNEEKHIQNCIKSVHWVDDIVVLDSGSTDNTIALAESCGARVFKESWRGFGPQKRRAVELAKNNWVLCLDADEELSRELSTEIYQFFTEKLSSKQTLASQVDGGCFPRKSYHLFTWITHGGWYPDFQYRFFNKDKCNWSDDLIHEKVMMKNPHTFKNDLIHYPFENLKAQIQKNNAYSSLLAEKLYFEAKKVQIIHHLFLKPIVKFIECYYFKRGFQDGIAGYIIASSAAFSQFLKYAKLWEMQKKEKSKNS